MLTDKTAKLLKIGVSGGLLIGAGLVGAFLIKGLVMLAIFGALGLCLWYGKDPLIQRLQHAQINALKDGAAKNPIPELILQRAADAKRIEKAAEEVTNFSTETKLYGSKLDDFKKTDPEEAKLFEETYHNMVRISNYQVTQIRNALAALKTSDDVIQKATRVWDMAQSQMRANKAMGKMNKIDPVAEVRKQTALDSVKRAQFQAMAQMEMAIALDYNSIDDLNKTPSLAHNPGQIIEMDMTEVTTLTEKAHA